MPEIRVVGFEPTNDGVKGRCLSTWLYPKIFKFLYAECFLQILSETLRNVLCHTIRESTHFPSCIHMMYLHTPQYFLLFHPQTEFLPYRTSIPDQKHTSKIRQYHCSKSNNTSLISLIFYKKQDTQAYHNVQKCYEISEPHVRPPR